MESAVQIRREEVAQVAASVFASMLALELYEAPHPHAPAKGETLTAAVFLTGSWEGALLLQCCPDDARRFASCFLGEPPAAEVNGEVRDVLGEIANMIAGNFKCTLRPGIRVSVPSVVSGTDYGLRLCGARLAEELELTSEAGSILLTVFEVPTSA